MAVVKLTTDQFPATPPPHPINLPFPHWLSNVQHNIYPFGPQEHCAPSPIRYRPHTVRTSRPYCWCGAEGVTSCFHCTCMSNRDQFVSKPFHIVKTTVLQRLC